MKKALYEARMIESEFEAVRQTLKQGVLNIQPLSILVAETTWGQSIPYAIVSDVQPSEHKIQLERLVEAMPIKAKRVKQISLGPGKKKKELLIIDSSSDE